MNAFKEPNWDELPQVFRYLVDVTKTLPIPKIQRIFTRPKPGQTIDVDKTAIHIVAPEDKVEVPDWQTIAITAAVAELGLWLHRSAIRHGISLPGFTAVVLEHADHRQGQRTRRAAA